MKNAAGRILFLLLALAAASAPLPASAGWPSAAPTRATAQAAAPPENPAGPEENLPAQAAVEKMWGFGQLLGLSCESRSAADWARRFGIPIRELPFLAKIPRSHNPDEGFVGSPNGAWGHIPPRDYGVHAAPVARVLRSYGANAAALRGMSFDRLRSEIAAGRPVIVWVTGHVQPGKSAVYLVDGKRVTVASYEHTVIAIGYDPKTVTVLDGKSVYKRPTETFLKAWAPLGNMAIIWDDSEANRDFVRRDVWREYGGR